MLTNKLKMNDSKTEMMVFAPPRAKLPVLSVSAGPEVHQPAASVRNLGLVMDTYLSMDLHVAKTCQTGYFQLRSIRSMQRVLAPHAFEKLVHAFITARLDYCNSVLIGIVPSDWVGFANVCGGRNADIRKPTLYIPKTSPNISRRFAKMTRTFIEFSERSQTFANPSQDPEMFSTHVRKHLAFTDLHKAVAKLTSF